MSPRNSFTTTAHARVGLLGNPSDIYGGAGIGFAVSELAATVTVRADERWSAPGEAGQLLEAAWQAFARELGMLHDGALPACSLSMQTTIPMQSGLGGSSAIVIAAMRAWGMWLGTQLAPMRLAHAAWVAEHTILGTIAGPLDRLVQAHEGLCVMEFQDPFAAASLEHLPPGILPPMLLAWHREAGHPSGDVHRAVFERWEQGDAQVRRVMESLAQLAREGAGRLRAGDRPRFLECIDRNFALRTKLFDVDPRDIQLIQCARSCGAAAKLPGSGGAVLVVAPDRQLLDDAEGALRQLGASTLRPTVKEPTP
ncbi:MAG: hypothetical protein O2819_04535 [Planctomycetota bacterium]|nr:hypothetical protein [Planctomycetota bacterium]MDA1106523.1 hypothetical protein [Planctomycetota bacterium]